MTSENPIELEVIIVSEGATLRELREKRVGLFDALERGLVGEGVKLEQAPDSRALDPAVVGAIGVILLPIVVDKLGDLLVDYLRPNDCSITLKVPVPRNGEVVVTFPPGTSSEEVKGWIASAIELVRAATK